jgi:hypothetical protein
MGAKFDLSSRREIIKYVFEKCAFMAIFGSEEQEVMTGWTKYYNGQLHLTVSTQNGQLSRRWNGRSM